VHYLRQKRTQLILSSFVLVSALLFEFPSLDLRVAALFFDSGFFLQGAWWERALHASVHYMLYLTTAGTLGLYLINKLYKRQWLGVDGRKLIYLLLVLTLGAGLVVNVALKEGVGRARPREVAEFGGPKLFTPAFAAARQCGHNCSFSSGHAAGAFFTLAFAYAFASQRRKALWAAAIYGGLVSLSRMVSGAHFFSDCVVSFFVMLITSDALYYLLIARAGRQAGAANERLTVLRPRITAGVVLPSRAADL
jgi:lipid A 4'-phosphatase